MLKPSYKAQVIGIGLASLFFAVILVFFGVSAIEKVVHVEDLWDDYNRQAIASSTALHEIHVQLGYGGFIHNFKNYVLRRESALLPLIAANLKAVQEAIGTYEKLELNQSEREALRQLRGVVKSYAEKMVMAKDAVAKGTPSSEIDRIVKVNDEPGLNAIASLASSAVSRSNQKEIETGAALTATVRFLLLGALIFPAIFAVGIIILLFLRRLVEANKNTKAAQEELANLLETTPQALITISRDGSILRANSQVEKLLGYKRDELLGQKVEILLPGQLRTAHSSLRDGYFKAPGFRPMGGALELKALAKNGREIPVEISLSHTIHRGGPVATASIVDISDRLRAEQALRESEALLRESQKMEAVGQLAGGIAHEFNNMLQVIISGAHFAQNSIRDSRIVEEALGIILKSAERSATLTKQLLAYSRKAPLVQKTININEMTSNLMKMIEPVIGEEVELEFKPADDLFPVKADANLLGQALVNLCVNARDAMPDGGRLLLETKNFQADQKFCEVHGLRQPGKYAIISVSDSGIGMATETREHIFEPFFTTKEVGKGTGLGLAMVQGIVQQHDGLVDVLSEPGFGSTFNIYLPRTDLPEAKKEILTVSESPGGKETILVAEDEKDVLRMISQSLESKGYRVLAAKDGEEALAVFKANAERIDLVILDMVMPKLRGRAVYEQIRKSGSDVPVIFNSGYSLDSSDAEYVAGKGLHTIQKPYAPDVLFSIVRRVLDQ